MFDGTYIARSIDLGSKYAFYDGAQRMVGLKCSEFHEKDLGVLPLQEAKKFAASSLRRAEQGGDANLFKRTDMAPEIFAMYLQSAIGPRDQPCLPILTMPKETQKGVSSNVQAGPAWVGPRRSLTPNVVEFYSPHGAT